MATMYFGLKFKSNPDYDAKNIAARLFLCPRLRPELVKGILERLSNGLMSASAVETMTNGSIKDLRIRLETEGNLSAVMCNHLEVWSNAFHAPSEKDYAYLEKQFGFKKADLFGPESVSPTSCFNSAKELADYVKQYIKGQNHAIEQLSVPFFQHLDSKRKNYTCRIKTPVLLMGPTGIGKSEVLRVFAKACDCPVIRINTSEVVPTGWRGMHISDVIARELSDTVTIKNLEYAVIVFHEFDKITHYGQTIVGSTGSDLDTDMMRDIMRLFETEHSLHIEDGFDKENMNTKSYKLPVDNFLIIFDGAFHGIESIIKRRLKIGSTIGFTPASQDQFADTNLQTLVTNEDLIMWGYMPELLGRIGEVVVMNPLTQDVIYEILTSAKESILQSHIDYCSKNNINLHFTDEALHYIAGEAQKSGLGFRNVKTILSKALNRLYFEMPEAGTSDAKQTIEISKDYVMKSICGKQL